MFFLFFRHFCLSVSLFIFYCFILDYDRHSHRLIIFFYLTFSRDRKCLHTVDTLVSGILKNRIHGNITRKEGERDENRRGTEEEKKRIETDSDNNSERIEGIKGENEEEIKEDVTAFGVIFSLTTPPPEGL